MSVDHFQPSESPASSSRQEYDLGNFLTPLGCEAFEAEVYSMQLPEFVFKHCGEVSLVLPVGMRLVIRIPGPLQVTMLLLIGIHLRSWLRGGHGQETRIGLHVVMMLYGLSPRGLYRVGGPTMGSDFPIY